jgi:hypothetical protein
VFEECEVPEDQRLGEIDHGFFDTLKILDKGRVGIGAWAVGIGRAALQASLRYAKERVQFDKPIAEFQAIQHMLADMATELDAARLLVWRAAVMQDHKLKTTQESAMAKYYAARATHARLQRRRADPRRLRLHARVRRRALPARRQAGGDRRGHERGARRWSSRASCSTGRPRVESGRRLAERVRAGDLLAAARLMRDLDDGIPGARPSWRRCIPTRAARSWWGSRGRRAWGSRRWSTRSWRATAPRACAWASSAVDPSSPFSGGALLGDRVRMQRHATGRGRVHPFRSRRAGSSAGSARRRPRRGRLDAAGFPVILVATVGVGQADDRDRQRGRRVVVVTAPGLGDGVQALKAGSAGDRRRAGRQQGGSRRRDHALRDSDDDAADLRAPGVAG